MTYGNYADIFTVPNPDRKRFQFWKRKRVPNPSLKYITFKLPPIPIEAIKEDSHD